MILKILSLIFLILLIRAAFSMFRLLGFIKNTADQMKDQLKSQYGYRRTDSNGDSETVYDRRDPQQAQQKIIPAEEGEYVDFEEAN